MSDLLKFIRARNDLGTYILDGHTPVAADVLTWARWFEQTERHVADEMIAGVRVSTVFLGLDHCFFDDGPPLLFETMVFGGALDQEMERCSTWEQAEQMHKRMVARVEKLRTHRLLGKHGNRRKILKNG